MRFRFDPDAMHDVIHSPDDGIADDHGYECERAIGEHDRRKVARTAQGEEREERRTGTGREEVEQERRLNGALEVRR